MLTLLLFCIPSVLFEKIGSGKRENGKNGNSDIIFKLTGILRWYHENYYNSYNYFRLSGQKKCGWWLWKLSAVFIFVSFIRELLIFSLFLFGIFFMY